MYLHLGGSTVVREREILGIFDIDTCSVGKRTREFLRKVQDAGSVALVSDDLPRSFIVTDRFTYISGVSPATLLRRSAGGIDKLGG